MLNHPHVTSALACERRNDLLVTARRRRLASEATQDRLGPARARRPRHRT
jgi:hypothetical protein